jgi:hypothetical protein
LPEGHRNGGGACWNDATCSKPRLAGDRAFFSGQDDQDRVGVYKAELLSGDGPSKMGGIFDHRNPHALRLEHGPVQIP